MIGIIDSLCLAKYLLKQNISCAKMIYGQLMGTERYGEKENKEYDT
ncbi:MAG: hypothetical protein IJA34_08200 [Lachnospiraceae bacterium]|nr:hypothetical protein [Lachnospiraceae bacterium]